MSEPPASIFNQMHKAGRRDNGKSSPVKIFNKDFKRHSRDQEMKFILTIFAIDKLLPCYMRGKSEKIYSSNELLKVFLRPREVAVLL